MFDVPWKALERHRQDFLSNLQNVDVTDEMFIEALGLSKQSRSALIAIGLRNIIAKDCGLQAGSIATSTKCVVLEKLMGPGTLSEWLFTGPPGFWVMW